MEVKAFNKEKEEIVIEDGGKVHTLSFECVDELVKLLLKVGYLEVGYHMEVKSTRRWRAGIYNL